MAKNKHTFAKRQREIEKKRKAEEKIAKRRAKRQDPEAQTDESGESGEFGTGTSTPEGLPGSSLP